MMYTQKGFILFRIFTFLLLSSQLRDHIVIASSAPQSEGETSFSYEEPTDWAKIKPKWEVCGNGKLQSPIDLYGRKLRVSPKLGNLKRDYRPAVAVLENKGYSISVKWKGYAGKITINGTSYKLEECHWHTPSEHTFNGSRYSLELHLVHKSSLSKTAVVGILYKYGKPDPFLSRLYPDIKSLEKEEKEIGFLNPGNIKFGNRKYFRYIGSLTTPPCTEGVVWTIMKKVRAVSREQVRILKDKVEDGFEVNARPTQQVNGRTVWLYSP